MKVGKADDVHNRICSLRRHWGDVDYAESYSLEAPANLIFRLEKALHVLLSEHSISFDVGDGKTELFSIQALGIALQHIEIFAPGRIVKGITRPAAAKKPTSSAAKHYAFYARERTASEAMKVTATGLAILFDRFNRWLLVLYRRQHRIEYEYTILDESTVFLRFRGDLVDRLDEQALFRCIDERGNLGGWPQVSSCKSGGVLQFEIRLQYNSVVGSMLRDHLLSHTLGLLKRMPQRSEAAKTEIPMLNMGAIAKSIFDRMNEEYEKGAIVNVLGQPVNHLLRFPSTDRSGDN
jgi:hypothetical protein